MLTSINTIIILMVTIFLVFALLIYLLRKNNPNQTHKIFICICVLMLSWLLVLILQATYSNILNINPIYFDYIIYISICFIPVFFFLLSISFEKTKFKFTKKHLLLFIVPVISLFVLWTNDWHHLFYKQYSINYSETVFGPYFYIHSLYTYGLFFISIISLLRFSIKNSGFFSKQAILILCGSLVPLLVNLFALLGIISFSIYITPICFAITVFCYTLAILKFDFLKVAPIALQRIVDRISDSYVIVNENNIITDFNQTFLNLFNLSSNEIRNISVEKLLDKISYEKVDNDFLLLTINSTKKTNDTIKLQKHFTSIDRHFNIEINSITNKDEFLGTLILFKDITQHISDIQTIQDNQEMLMEKERLATLGQMIGGIAHNLKTPIMSIAGAVEGLSDLSKEYRSSISDPDVTVQDHYEIANDMDAWLEKIRTHLAYMSDIITAIKGQAVAFSDNTVNNFTVGELLKNIDILMKHELKNALIELVVNLEVGSETAVNGNVNSLVQVVNNVISNAIQAYNGKKNEQIFLNIYKEKHILVIKIQDNAGGLPQKVQDKLFKEMITTKGKNGTGLGLFMSYSNIKAHFNGNMRFETTVRSWNILFYRNSS